MVIHSIKKHALLALLLITYNANAEQPITGLIGGTILEPPFPGYAAVIDPSGTVTSIPLGITLAAIQSVALNNSGIGLIGGVENSNGYAAFVSSASEVLPISNLLPGNISSVAINNSSRGLIGGFSGSNAYAAFVAPGLDPIQISTLPATDISSVAINNSNFGLLGGFVGGLGSKTYASFVDPSGVATAIAISSSGAVTSVALNDQGIGIIGGSNGRNAYAAFVSVGSVTPISISLPILPRFEQGRINSVALNNSNIGLIGGFNVDSAYAAFIFPGNTMPLPISDLPNGEINAVALNDSSFGLIGGENFDTNFAYAAIVSPNVAPKSLTGLPVGVINSVAINKFNQGLIGGDDIGNNVAYAAIVSPSGQVIPLTIGLANSFINSVAINSFFLSMIPTQGLVGNNLIFADYINANAPQDVFYFLPSIVEGSLPQALESAAPTRNAISFNTVMQNSFYMTTSLSTHIRDQRPIHRRHVSSANRSTALMELGEAVEEELLASQSIQKSKPVEKKCAQSTECIKALTTQCRPNTVWIEGVGALASQKAQHETPGFDPKSAGGILGFDTMASDHAKFGFGGTYLYTKIDEDDAQGHSKIQQEDLFLYFSWEPNHFYVDIAAWGGLYQTKQTRNIHMTGFDFTSTSKPKGWQVVPHLELGWTGTPVCSQKFELSWTLLGMADWANAWQKKYRETGSGPFNVKQKSYYGSLLRSEGGLRFTETFFCKCWNLIFQEKGSYVNVQSFGKSGKVHAFLIGSPGAFTVETLTNAQNLGVVQLLVTAAPYRCCFPTTTLFWQGEFGSGYASHQLNFELAWSF